MINLLPNHLREERAYGRKNRVLIGFIIAFLSSAILVAVIMIGSLNFVGADETDIQTEIDTNNQNITILESQISDLSAVSTRLTAADTLYENSIRFSELLPQIGSLVPAGAVLDSLSLTGGSTDPLSLDFRLTSADLAPVIQRNLVDSEVFEAADINTISPIEDLSAYTFSTSISVSFTGTAEAKRKAASAAAAAAQAAAENNSDGGSGGNGGNQ